MDGESVRFIHAGDFLLHQPPGGLSEVPSHLRELLLDAPYIAAQNAFDTVLAEGADFLLLSGNLLDPMKTGPRGPVFLLEQFRRLAERGISVYWAGGIDDPPELWPPALPLPSNIHLFPRGRVDEYVFERDGRPLARILGISHTKNRLMRPGDFHPDPGTLPTIAMAFGQADSNTMQARGVHYWALGGREDRLTPSSGKVWMHYCGTPQSRKGDETSPHGCTFVHIDEQKQIRMSSIPTDVYRWARELVSIADVRDREELQCRLRERTQKILRDAAERNILVRWQLTGEGELTEALTHGSLIQEMTAWLRNEFGFASPTLWTVSFEYEVELSVPETLFEQETICGDYLRLLRQWQVNPDLPLDLDKYVSASHEAGWIGSLVVLNDSDRRRYVIEHATALGTKLLQGNPAD